MSMLSVSEHSSLIEGLFGVGSLCKSIWFSLYVLSFAISSLSFAFEIFFSVDSCVFDGSS